MWSTNPCTYLVGRLRQERLELVRDPEEGLGLEGREPPGLVQGQQLLVGLEQLCVGVRCVRCGSVGAAFPMAW